MRIIICDDDITFADKLQKEIGSFLPNALWLCRSLLHIIQANNF